MLSPFKTPEIYGFTFLRNGVKYDYPFRETLLSLFTLTSNVVLVLGQSEDGTEKAIEVFKKSLEPHQTLTVIPTVWNENQRKSGIILSEQTNVALQALKKQSLGKGWGFYLQCDEVLSEEDVPLIHECILKAEAEGSDAIRFRYLHFWKNYQSIAISKKWYPQEIRCIKLSAPIESYGDAQSFKGTQKILESDAFIFHYGHVREEKAYERKKSEFHRWWHTDTEIQKKIKKAAVDDLKQKTLRYLGPHPKVMEGRMKEWKGPLEENCSSGFRKWFQKWKKIPRKMDSKHARPWPDSFIHILEQSKKGIRVSSLRKN